MLQLRNSLVVCAVVLVTALGLQANTVPAEGIEASSDEVFPAGPCPTTDQDFETLMDVGHCTIGDKIFSHFDLSSSGHNPISASHLNYSIINHGTEAIGFEFKPEMAAHNGTTSHLTIGFTVASTGPDINDATLALGPGSGAFGHASLSIVESLHPLFSGHQVLTVTAPTGARSDEVIFSPPVDIIAVTKTATVTSSSGSVLNFAAISTFNETFSQVPEPRTMLLFGSGLLLIGIVVRRKQGAQKREIPA